MKVIVWSHSRDNAPEFFYGFLPSRETLDLVHVFYTRGNWYFQVYTIHICVSGDHLQGRFITKLTTPPFHSLATGNIKGEGNDRHISIL